jgi:hypothetical protein
MVDTKGPASAIKSLTGIVDAFLQLFQRLANTPDVQFRKASSQALIKAGLLANKVIDRTQRRLAKIRHLLQTDEAEAKQFVSLWLSDESDKIWIDDLHSVGICSELRDCRSEIEHLFMKNAYMKDSAEFLSLLDDFFWGERETARFIRTSLRAVEKLLFDESIPVSVKIQRILDLSDELYSLQDKLEESLLKASKVL